MLRPSTQMRPSLKPIEAMILVVLSISEMHGYGIVKEIERRSLGGTRLEPGNLYRVIRRLIARGWVDRAPAKKTPESGDERRRYFAVTESGRAVLAEEAVRLRHLASLAEEAAGDLA